MVGDDGDSAAGSDAQLQIQAVAGHSHRVLDQRTMLIELAGLQHVRRVEVR